MKDFDKKLRKAKELNSNDFGDNLLRDPGPGFDPGEMRFDIPNLDPKKIFRKTKRKVLLLTIGILYVLVALITGTVQIFGYLADLILVVCR